MSLDFNPIGNIFNFVWSKLNEDAIAMDITKEDFNSISARVKSTISSDSTDFTDKAIESMNKETYETDNCWKRTRKKILDASWSVQFVDKNRSTPNISSVLDRILLFLISIWLYF